MEVGAQELIGLLESKITLYKHLGIEVVRICSEEVRFRVSLEKSRNHKGTAFGGSLYADAVLAAYALILVGLRERQIPTENIVIAKGEIQYFRPVDSDFEVVCQFPSKEDENAFFSDLLKNGKVRGSLTSQILGSSGGVKASLTGLFVIKL